MCGFSCQLVVLDYRYKIIMICQTHGASAYTHKSHTHTQRERERERERNIKQLYMYYSVDKQTYIMGRPGYGNVCGDKGKPPVTKLSSIVMPHFAFETTEL